MGNFTSFEKIEFTDGVQLTLFIHFKNVNF